MLIHHNTGVLTVPALKPEQCGFQQWPDVPTKRTHEAAFESGIRVALELTASGGPKLREIELMAGHCNGVS